MPVGDGDGWGGAGVAVVVANTCVLEGSTGLRTADGVGEKNGISPALACTVQAGSVRPMKITHNFWKRDARIEGFKFIDR
jgi:hypothetical protein